jgi:hypothetical protein
MHTRAAVPEAECPDPGRDLARVELGDIVRLKEPFVEKIGRQKVSFTFGIVAEIVATLPDGRTRNVCLYLYDPERKEIAFEPNGVPESVDFHCSEIELYRRATDSWWMTSPAVSRTKEA